MGYDLGDGGACTYSTISKIPGIGIVREINKKKLLLFGKCEWHNRFDFSRLAEVVWVSQRDKSLQSQCNFMGRCQISLSKDRNFAKIPRRKTFSFSLFLMKSYVWWGFIASSPPLGVPLGLIITIQHTRNLILNSKISNF